MAWLLAGEESIGNQTSISNFDYWTGKKKTSATLIAVELAKLF
jgi:hypothetical protein